VSADRDSAGGAPPLAATVELVRRAIALERKQGYQNRATTGGLHRYFQHQFGKHTLDERTTPLVEGLLRDLKRYEGAGSVAERHTQTEIVLRRLEDPAWLATAPVPRDTAIGPVSPDHRGDAESMARVRGGPLTPTKEPATAVAWQTTGTAVPGTGETSASPHNRPQSASFAIGVPTAVGRQSQAAPDKGGEGAPAPRAESLTQPLNAVLKIRAQEWEKLERLGLRTVEDALYYLPRDYYDCRNPVPLNKLRLGMTTTIVGTLQTVNVRKTARNHTIVEAKIADGTAIVRVSWFNQQHVARVLRPHIGQRIAVSGHTELYNNYLQFVPRDYEFPDEDEAIHTGRLVPVYPLTEGLTQRWLRGVIRKALDAALHLVVDPLPPDLRRDHALPPLQEALRAYHMPAGEEEKGAATHRLAFDELLCVSIGMLRRKRDWQQGAPARPIPHDPDALERFEAELPFALTGAQRRVLRAILGDMARSVPMSRLLQGDVGSGKTVVAAAALLVAAQAGLQGAIMAPTEILAEQHARSMARVLAPFGVEVALLTGSVKGPERKRVYAGAADGSISLLVGTHALIQEGVTFDRLALAVVDEQHRFGVEQRGALRQKGYNPHVLAMTATPIPRTLSLTLYGDLDVAVIDERPPGRQPIETSWVPSDATAYRVVREQVTAGRQAFVVCPLVEESDKSEARAAVAEQKRLQRDVFPDLSVGLLHGKMKGSEKEAILKRFRDGEIQILVATSVVEVGIDVPNATVMVVQEANRFGLAQLHQFRGRVGRGAEQSYCILLAEGASAVGQQRLQALTATDDGFKLAEEDLRLRGPGEFWGTRQSGVPELTVAGVGDARVIEEARGAAERVVAADPDLTQPAHQLLAARVERFWSRGSERS
jgi:ATP-dependent DNA helicase RecG